MSDPVGGREAEIEAVWLCPIHAEEFWMPHGGLCPLPGCDRDLAKYVRSSGSPHDDPDTENQRLRKERDGIDEAFQRYRRNHTAEVESRKSSAECSAAQTRCSGCTEAVKDEEPLRFRHGVLWHEACLSGSAAQNQENERLRERLEEYRQDQGGWPCGCEFTDDGEETAARCLFHRRLFDELERLRAARSSQDEDQPTCGTCGGAKDKPALMSDDSYSQFPCPSPFHRSGAAAQEKP